MELKLRGVGAYLAVKLVVGNTSHDLGFHDKAEAETLSSMLRDYSDEIESWLLRTFPDHYRPIEPCVRPANLEYTQV